MLCIRFDSVIWKRSKWLFTFGALHEHFMPIVTLFIPLSRLARVSVLFPTPISRESCPALFQRNKRRAFWYHHFSHRRDVVRWNLDIYAGPASHRNSSEIIYKWFYVPNMLSQKCTNKHPFLSSYSFRVCLSFILLILNVIALYARSQKETNL